MSVKAALKSFKLLCIILHMGHLDLDAMAATSWEVRAAKQKFQAVQNSQILGVDIL